MYNNLNTDVKKIIIANLSLKDLIKLRITNRDNVEIVKYYNNYDMIKIKGSLKNWKKSFPNMISANISNKLDIIIDDYKYFDNIQILRINLCNQKTIINNNFSYLLNIKELVLEVCECYGHWTNGHHFNDEMFNYLVNLEKFYIDDNHIITDYGIQKLTKIKDLKLRNCINITNNGLSNLTTLIKLHIYNLNKLTDDVFKNLNNLQELDMTFCHNITDKGILYLSNIQKINCICCREIKCKDYDKLLRLNNLSPSSSIEDNDLIYLKNIKCLTLFGCNIKGSGFQYLKNIEILSIYESPIIDIYLDYFLELKNLKKINIYRCDHISKSKKNKLKVILGDKFNTD